MDNSRVLARSAVKKCLSTVGASSNMFISDGELIILLIIKMAFDQQSEKVVKDPVKEECKAIEALLR